MTAAARSGEPGAAPADGRPRFTIGEVLADLHDEFPDVTISKIRYLEGEDLVHPQRTPSGYRKFSTADVDRLRYVLTAQRDHYLPLRVIKEQLDALDRGETPPGSVVARVVPEAVVPVGGGDGAAPDIATPATATPTTPATAGEGSADDGPLTAREFGDAAGLDQAQLADCVQFGVLTPAADGRFPAADLSTARAAAGLARHGIEPRHLRVFRSGAEREAALVEQIVAPALLARSEETQARAGDQLRELGELATQLHASLLRARLREVLGGSSGG